MRNLLILLFIFFIIQSCSIIKKPNNISSTSFNNNEILKEKSVLNKSNLKQKINNNDSVYKSLKIGNNSDSIFNQIINPLLESICSRWIGTPYKYGGNSIEGTDCSGFAGNVYSELFSIELKRSANDIYYQCTPISKENLIPGDLIFFKINNPRISHVGIYLGNNEFIHASSKKGVTKNNLNEEYYLKYFFSGGRIQ